MKSSLDYSSRALAIAPAQIHFKFNIAFVQIQLAQLLYGLPESQRNLAEVQAAAEGLEAAIESFTAIAQSKNPPYPKHDIEQRANMGRNTMRRQLERAVQSQREYEDKNAAKLQEARDAREAEMRRREEEKARVAKIAEEQKRKIAEERHKMLEVSRELAERRAEEERRKEEALYTEDEETGERVRRKKVKKAGKRKKKGDESDTDGEGGDSGRRQGKSTEDDGEESGAVDDAARAPKKRRKLARKGQGKDGFKSSEMVVDSSSEGEDGVNTATKASNGIPSSTATNGVANGDVQMNDVADDDDEEEANVAQQPRKKTSRRIADDDDEDDEADDATATAPRVDAYSDEDDSAAEDSTPTKRNVFVDGQDEPMVDASVAAAGDEDAVG